MLTTKITTLKDYLTIPESWLEAQRGPSRPKARAPEARLQAPEAWLEASKAWLEPSKAWLKASR